METMTTSSIITAVTSYLAKTLKANRSVKDFFNDFTDATVAWIRPVFLIDDEEPKEIIQDLINDPDEELNITAVENAIAKLVKKNPDTEESLRLMYDQLKEKAKTDSSISIINSKNVITGDISAGGNITIGDSNHIN